MRKDSRRDRWSLPKLWSECAAKFQRLRRLQEADKAGFCKCVTCGVRKHFAQMEGGHFITRSRKSVLLDPMNVHPQCNACNQHKGGNGAEYASYMIKRYGEDQVEFLKLKSRQIVNVTRGDLMEVYERICDELRKEERKRT